MSARKSVLLAVFPVVFLALFGAVMFLFFRESQIEDACTLSSQRLGRGDRVDDWSVSLACPGGKVYRAVWERMP